MAPDRGLTDASETLPAQLDSLQLHNGAESHAHLISPDPILETTPSHLSHDPTNNSKRSDPFQFGQRYLSNNDDVFEFNAWDHVTPDEEHILYSEEQYAKQRAAPVSDFDRERFNTHPEKWWDLFYKQKSATFFKDRKWLVQEFPLLGELTQPGAGKKVVLEVGAGAGNTAFPVMRLNKNEELQLVAADFSKRAVETMREADDYAAIAEGRDQRVGSMRAEVWDVAGDALPPGMDEHSADVVIMIFVFSALSPRQWHQAMDNVWRLLKPGGDVLFRDYGRGDLAQVRFKAGRWMEENFYVRGDGTRVYFFDKDELERMWSGVTAAAPGTQSCDQNTHQNDTDEVNKLHPEPMVKSGDDRPLPRFDILNLDVDRRLIVNRQQRIKMYRCWIQGRFRKPKIS